MLLVAISDTSPSAQVVLTKTQRAMSGEQRLLLAYEMSLFTRDLAREGILRDHPDWTDGEVANELLRMAFLPGRLPSPLR